MSLPHWQSAAIPACTSLLIVLSAARTAAGCWLPERAVMCMEHGSKLSENQTGCNTSSGTMHREIRTPNTQTSSSVKLQNSQHPEHGESWVWTLSLLAAFRMLFQPNRGQRCLWPPEILLQLSWSETAWAEGTSPTAVTYCGQPCPSNPSHQNLLSEKNILVQHPLFLLLR